MTVPSFRIKKIGTHAVLLLISVLAAFIIGEAALRLLDIPGIDFNHWKYDDLVGAIYYPGSTLTYRNDRGAHLFREINSWGYPDVEHKMKKAEGTYRIGFFGDSYTESIQVDLENTFFRLIENQLRDRNIECLAFGLSGFGTVHAYLENHRSRPAFDIDLSIYVFCENDLANNIIEISKVSSFPSAVLTDEGFRIDNSFRKYYQYKQALYFKAYDYLTAHSLFFATLASRLKLLCRYGIKPTVSDEDRLMTAGSLSDDDEMAIPTDTTPPSSWPLYWRDYATQLGSAIILRWKEEMEVKGKAFAILYVPSPGEMAKDLEEQDAWKLWLVSLCRDNGISLIDPTNELLAFQESGLEVFYDHYTEDGHRAVAQSFIQHIDDIL
jgi:hypothetical protein